ncbi:MAG: hypothetical protein WC370_00545 [Dehalococcoidales bacterium]
MTDEEQKFRIHWSWGLLGLLGILGWMLEQPVFYWFFVLFLLFLEPLIRKIKK